MFDILKQIFKPNLFNFYHKTPLNYAVENENIELIELLLSNKKTDPNVKYILNNKCFI